MKNLLLFFVFQICMLQMNAQHFALSNDRMNIAYLGVDNPISIAVENCPCKNIVLKVKNGTVVGQNCRYIFRGKEVGAASIVVYEKNGKQLKVIGEYPLKVKRFPPPTFKIGPYGSSYFYDSDRKVQKVVLANQQYVRAELEGFDIDIHYSIDSFAVKIFYNDSFKVKTFVNASNKINQELSNGFSILKKDDVILFHNIFITGPDGQHYELDPLILTIDK